MELTKGLNFIQDAAIQCEVKSIYTPARVRGKKQNKRIIITKNGKDFDYDFNCFQNSFNRGLVFGSFKIN